MKNLIIISIVFIKSTAFSQDYSFVVENNYQSLFGSNSDMTAFNPIFKLDGDNIFNKTESSKIRALPKELSNYDLAYGFLYFAGNSNPIFENEIVFLVKNYMSEKPILYFDKNGNLDFTDDDAPIEFSNDFKLVLKNSMNQFSALHYLIGKSEISPKNQEALQNRFSSKYHKSNSVPSSYWLTNQRMSVRLSKGKINEKPITIFLFDEDGDGLFTANTDKIYIDSGFVELGEDVSSFLRKASLINNNARFLIHNNTYSLKQLDEAGGKLTITSSANLITKINGVGDIISTLKIDLLNGQILSIESLFKEEKYTLLEVGGTWCGGCIAQKPIIKEIYDSNIANVIGVFANDTEARVNIYIKKHSIKWQIGLMDEAFKKQFGINLFPTYILISPKGKIEMIEMEANKIKEYLNKVK
jgi:thiol-disulfide isomerase/thioredoxin